MNRTEERGEELANRPAPYSFQRNPRRPGPSPAVVNATALGLREGDVDSLPAGIPSPRRARDRRALSFGRDGPRPRRIRSGRRRRGRPDAAAAAGRRSGHGSRASRRVPRTCSTGSLPGCVRASRPRGKPGSRRLWRVSREVRPSRPEPAARRSGAAFDAADRRRRAEDSIVAVLRAAGLREVILPVLDYATRTPASRPRATSVSTGSWTARGRRSRSERTSRRWRPASSLRAWAVDGTASLFYRGDVVRDEETGVGRPREFAQVGAERYGDARFEADEEMLGLLLDALGTLPSAALRLTLGFAGLLRKVVEAATGCRPRAAGRASRTSCASRRTPGVRNRAPPAGARVLGAVAEEIPGGVHGSKVRRLFSGHPRSRKTPRSSPVRPLPRVPPSRALRRRRPGRDPRAPYYTGLTIAVDAAGVPAPSPPAGDTTRCWAASEWRRPPSASRSASRRSRPRPRPPIRPRPARCASRSGRDASSARRSRPWRRGRVLRRAGRPAPPRSVLGRGVRAAAPQGRRRPDVRRTRRRRSRGRRERPRRRVRRGRLLPWSCRSGVPPVSHRPGRRGVPAERPARARGHEVPAARGAVLRREEDRARDRPARRLVELAAALRLTDVVVDLIETARRSRPTAWPRSRRSRRAARPSSSAAPRSSRAAARSRPSWAGFARRRVRHDEDRRREDEVRTEGLDALLASRRAVPDFATLKQVLPIVERVLRKGEPALRST